MKKLIFTTLFFITVIVVKGQEGCFTYFPNQVGKMWTYKNYDKRGRLQSSTQNVIKAIANGQITVQTYSFDKNGEPLGLKDKDGNIQIMEGEFDAVCENGKLLLKPESFKSAFLNWFQGVDAEVTGDYVQMSAATMAENETLPDYSLKIVLESFIKTTIAISVYDRVVGSAVLVETPAGTFNCWRIASVTRTEMGIVNKTNTSVTWVAPGIGMVKNITYKRNGNVLSTTVLEDINW